MKQIILFIIISSLSLSVTGNNSKLVSLSFDDSDFIYYGNDSCMHIVPTLDDFIYKSEINKPALPYIGIKVLIDSSSEYMGHNNTSLEMLVRENIRIAPNQIPLPVAIPSYPVTEDEASFQYPDSTYPSIEIEYTGTYVIGGYKILCFLVCPFRYDVENRKLYLKKNINLNISLIKRKVEGTRTYYPNLQMKQRIEDLVINKEDLTLNTDKKNVCSKSAINEPKYEYLIVTRDSLKNEFQRLADWKTIKGVRTKVITLEDIYANTSDNRPQIRIKSFLKDYYDNSNDTLQYVLLGGDHEIVPAELCRVSCLSWELDTINGGYHTVMLMEDTPADLYYASFKNLDWDTNENGIIGEVKDSIDFSSDIIVTRLSVNSVSDAQCQINRILQYEQNPDTIDWRDNILLSGTTLGDVHYNYPDSIGRRSDTHYKCEKLLFQKYIQNNWNNAERKMFYDTGTSFEGGADYHFRVYHIQEQFARGYSFFHVETHGDFDWWKMEWRSDSIPKLQLYLVDDALAISNPRNTIVTTCACKSNGFSTLPTCLSEAFMRNHNSGIIAYYGCSESGWYVRDSITEGPSNKYIGMFYKKLLTQNQHQLGRAVYDSKMGYISCCHGDGSMRWLMFGMNILCDPEMPVYLSKPQVFDNVDISVSGNSLSVTTGLQNCKICVSSKDDSGESFFEVADSVNCHQFIIPLGTYNVCITKQGYIPYKAVVGGTVYVQNEDIASDRNIFASDVFIGKDVTTEKPQGSVTISGGTTKIKSKGNVKITKGFSVERGSRFEIRKWE